MDLEESENRRLKRKVASLEEENRNQSARIESLSTRIESFEARIEPLEEENRKQSARTQQLLHYLIQHSFTLSDVLPIAYFSPTEELVTLVIKRTFSRPPTFEQTCSLFIAVLDPSQHPPGVFDTLDLPWYRNGELWSIERSCPVAPIVWTKLCNLFCPLLTERLTSLESRIDVEWAAYMDSPNMSDRFLELYCSLKLMLVRFDEEFGNDDHVDCLTDNYDATFVPSLRRLFRATALVLHPDKQGSELTFKKLSNAMSDMQALYSLDHLPCSKEYAACKDLYHLMHRQAWNNSGVCEHSPAV